jgi:hypothetical protein
MTNKLLALFCAALSAIYYYGATRIPALDVGGDPLGPRAFPMLLAVCLLFCMALLMLEQRRHGSPDIEHGNLRVVFVTAALVAFYFILFEALGYLLSTILFMTIAMLRCHARKWVALLCAVLFPLASSQLFALLGVSLPSGASFL